MKKVFNKSTLIALMLVTLSASATPDSSLNNFDDSTPVVFGYIKEGTQIFIRDNQNYLLYKFKVDQTGYFSKIFDFTTLPDGDYFFEINEEHVIQFKPFMVVGGEVTFKEGENYTFFKPVISSKNEKVTMSWLTLKKEPLEVKIYDTKEHLLYKERITKNSDIKRVFDMSQIKVKDFVFTISAGGKIFKEQVSVNKNK